MKKLFLISVFFCCMLSTGVANEKNQNTTDTDAKDTPQESSEDSKDCKDVCVKRDGYGLCLEFEQRCKE